MRAIVTHGLYIFTHFLKSISFFSRSFFQKILLLCMVGIQEWFLIKSGLWWHAYGNLIISKWYSIKVDGCWSFVYMKSWPWKVMSHCRDRTLGLQKRGYQAILWSSRAACETTSHMDSPDGKAFNLDLVILACFANEPISMMAATFQSDINHQSQVAHQSSI